MNDVYEKLIKILEVASESEINLGSEAARHMLAEKILGVIDGHNEYKSCDQKTFDW